MTIVVGLDAGGTVDTFVRALVPYLKKHIPGSPNILVQNMPGAGGVVATNYLAEKAPKDGTVMIYQPWDPLGQALGNAGLRTRYDLLEYIGGIADVRIDYARVDSIPGGLKTPADVMKANPMVAGALNNTDMSGLLALMSLEVLGVKTKFITGYRGGQDIFLAVQRGEVHLHNTSIGTFRTRGAAMSKDGTVIGIAYLVGTDKDGNFEKNPHITEMPAFPQLYRDIHGKAPSGPDWDALNWLMTEYGDVTFTGFAPQGTPAAALVPLRAGFAAAVNDPQFAADGVKRNGIPYQFVPVEKGQAVFKALAEVSPEVLDTVRRKIEALGK